MIPKNPRRSFKKEPKKKKKKQKKQKKQKQKNNPNSSNDGGVTVNKYGRRKWNASYFLSKQQQQEEKEQQGDKAKPLSVDDLTARKDSELDFSDVVGKKSKVDLIADDDGTFSCDVCMVSFKNDSAYLDHLNSREHNYKVGKSMRAKRSSLSTIKKLLAAPPKKKEKKKKAEITIEEIEKRLEKKIKKIDSKRSGEKPKKKGNIIKTKKYVSSRQTSAEDLHLFRNPHLMKAFGFDSFGKKNK